MLRGGWLHFSIIAKGSSLFDAMTLCRNWDEFYELTMLASFQYFPASNWATWVGDRKRQQMLQLVSGGLEVYRVLFELTAHHRDLFLTSRTIMLIN